MEEAEAICLTCLISKMIPVQMVAFHPFHCAYNDFSNGKMSFYFLVICWSAWDYSAWVRTYALFLEERLECFRVLKYDVETDRPVRIFLSPPLQRFFFQASNFISVIFLWESFNYFLYINMLYLHFRIEYVEKLGCLGLIPCACLIEKRKENKENLVHPKSRTERKHHPSPFPTQKKVISIFIWVIALKLHGA